MSAGDARQPAAVTATARITHSNAVPDPKPCFRANFKAAPVCNPRFGGLPVRTNWAMGNRAPQLSNFRRGEVSVFPPNGRRTAEIG
jgi:hypothetical protein